jgi:hypothetical protein
MIDAPPRRRPSAGLVFAIAFCLVQAGAFWLAWTPDQPKPGLLIDIGGWLLLSVTAMSGVSLLIFKIDREQRKSSTADLVMLVGLLAPILLFMLAIGFLRPIQWEPLTGALCGASGFACLAVGIYLYRRSPKRR